MNMPHNYESLSSILKSASEAILNTSEISNRRIFAATRGQLLDRTSEIDLKMKPCWLLLQYGPDEEGEPCLNALPILPGNMLFPIYIELDPAFLTMLTNDRHVFGGETIVYEPGHEPDISIDTIKSEESIEACLRAPKGAKVLQPVEVGVFEYNSKLVIDGPEDFFLPTGEPSIDGLIDHDNACPYSYNELPNYATPRDIGSNGNWEDICSTLLDLANAPETTVTRATLIPTCWLPGSIGLDFQADWHDKPGKAYTWAQVGPFRISHDLALPHDDCGCLETSIRYTGG